MSSLSDFVNFSVDDLGEFLLEKGIPSDILSIFSGNSCGEV